MALLPQTNPTLARLPSMRAATRFDNDAQVPMHRHDTPELVFVLKGNLRIDVAGVGPFFGTAGTLFVLPGRIEHNQICEGPWKTKCVLYEHAGEFFDSSARTLNLQNQERLWRWVEDLCALFDAREHHPRATLDALFYGLLSQVAWLEASTRERDSVHPRLAEALALLHEDPARQLDAQGLARESHLSVPHLNALFRAHCGCGPLKYQQSLRMERARRLLGNPYLGLDQVAAECGYDDTNYFVRLFRKVHGLPPGRWRKSGRSRAPLPNERE